MLLNIRGLWVWNGSDGPTFNGSPSGRLAYPGELDWHLRPHAGGRHNVSAGDRIRPIRRADGGIAGAARLRLRAGYSTAGAVARGGVARGKGQSPRPAPCRTASVLDLFSCRYGSAGRGLDGATIRAHSPR